jgi:hypothetical protein
VIQRRRVEWAKHADEILVEYGAVLGTTIYPERQLARYRARSLISLMVDLDLHPRSELREHTDRCDGGWIWAVELVR